MSGIVRSGQVVFTASLLHFPGPIPAASNADDKNQKFLVKNIEDHTIIAYLN